MLDILVFGLVLEFLPQYGIAWQVGETLFVSVIRDSRCSRLLTSWLRYINAREKVSDIRLVTAHKSLSDEVRSIFKLLDSEVHSSGSSLEPSMYSKLQIHRLSDYLDGDLGSGSSRHMCQLLPPEGQKVARLYLSVYTSYPPFRDITFVPKLSNDTTTLADHTAISLGIKSVQSQKENAVKSKNDSTSLVAFMNKCVTAGGRRRLKTTFIHHPLLCTEQIRSRQSLINVFMNDRFLKLKVQNLVLNKLVDFDMISYQLGASRSLTPANQKRLIVTFSDILCSIEKLQTLEALFSSEPKFKSCVVNFERWLQEPLEKHNNDLCKLAALIRHVFSVDKLVEAKYDGTVAVLNPELLPTVNDLIQQLNTVQAKMTEAAERLESKVSQRATKSNPGQKIKIVTYPSCGKVFRVPRTVDVPKEAILIRINKAESLFTTVELQRLNKEFEDIQENMMTLETSFVAKVLEIAGTYLKPICQVADLVGEIDFCLSVASLLGFFSSRNEWIHADIRDENSPIMLHIQDGKHPLLELQSGLYGGAEPVVTNDVQLVQNETQILLITGPNMGGKSTFARQQALIALMSQWGCPVPAKYATLNPFVVFWTRIGAEDNPVQGMSTFMTEAVETAFLLKMVNALAERDTALLIIDELGRGTSSCDGLALSAAVLKKLSLTPNVFALFATHFHQLTSEKLNCVGTYCTAKIKCFEVNDEQLLAPLKQQLISGDKVSLSTFKVRRGVEPDSDGILLAKLFGFPPELINRALGIAQMPHQREELSNGVPAPT